MGDILMPKATAVWLIDNTTLSFEQVADFCGLHKLEVKGIADGDVAENMRGVDPISGGELTREEIRKGEGNPEYRLKKAESKIAHIPQPKRKGARYTPVARRQDKPDAIAWFIRNHLEVSDAQISKLIGTTKPTINAIRDRTHWNTPNIKPQNPVGLGLCTGDNLEMVVAVARKRAGITHSPGAAMAPDGINPVAMASETASGTEPTPEAAMPQTAEASIPTELVEPELESEPAAEPQPESEALTEEPNT